MRIAFVADGNGFGGSHVYIRHLLRQLPPDYERHLIVSATIARYFEEVAGCCESVTLVPLGEGRKAAPDVTAALLGIQPDLRHVNMIRPGLNRAALAAALSTGPTVATVNLDGYLDNDPADEADRAELAGLYAQLRHVISVSERITHQLRDDLGVPPSRITRVHYGVHIPEQPAELPGTMPLTIGVIAARLGPQKALDTLFAAVSLLLRGRRDFEVLVVGDGPARKDLERQAAEQRLPITILGYCDDIWEFFRSLDIFCLPSRSEGTPLALLEAMGQGLPIVATAVGDVAEVLGDDAMVVDPEDPQALSGALDHLLSSQPERKDLAARIRARALQSFTVPRMIEDTDAIFRAALLA